jgi:two-component system OmpR family response regulator
MRPTDKTRPIDIAVVDDDASVLDAVRLVLEKEGWSARTYSSGETFLASLDNSPPDCLILDPHLPGLGGAEVARRVSTNGYAIPIIALTAWPGTPETEEILDSGVHAMLTKPVKAEALVDLVRQSVA